MLSQITLLILEDQPEICELIEFSLCQHIPNIHIAHSIKEAIFFIRQHDFSIALIDVNLPDGTPYELIQKLLQQQCKVILMSGNFELHPQLEALSLPKLEKPFRIPALLKKIEEVFSHPVDKKILEPIA